jgi:tRNA(Ile)-lysidine synthase
MLGRLKKFVADQRLFSPDQRILLAVSGGMDSVVMAELFHKACWHFGIAHCNFTLRDEESEDDEHFVEELAQRLHVMFYSKRFFTSEDAERKKISVQMAARELRYGWFEEVRQQEGYAYVATAHHLDDQAETFFINLLRGTGLSGLHGILPKQGTVIRPMLFAFRSEFERYAREHHIRYREDSSNSSPKYLRNRIRSQLIPLLNDLNPEFSSIMAENIGRFRDAEEIYRKEIGRAVDAVLHKEQDRIVLPFEQLFAFDPVRTYAYELLSPFGFNEAVIKDVLKCLEKPERKLFRSPGWTLLKDRSKLVLTPRKHDDAKIAGEVYLIPEGRKSISRPVTLKLTTLRFTPDLRIPGGKRYASLDAGKLEYPLRLRPWQPGDSFYPFGMNKRKKVSDFFIDSKLSSEEKAGTWILWSGNKIAWIVGRRVDNRFRVTPKTRVVLRIRAT